MAKPLSINSSSFCLAVFGTNNKFKTKDVFRRVNKIVVEVLKEEGINVLGISSDGDSRLLIFHF